jgi:hypothetical protein
MQHRFVELHKMTGLSQDPSPSMDSHASLDADIARHGDLNLSTGHLAAHRRALYTWRNALSPLVRLPQEVLAQVRGKHVYFTRLPFHNSLIQLLEKLIQLNWAPLSSTARTRWTQVHESRRKKAPVLASVGRDRLTFDAENEEVGRAIRDSSREEIFITTKLCVACSSRREDLDTDHDAVVTGSTMTSRTRSTHH